ncbi:MAG: MFS transporter [Syntrophorhabdales bacterium]|jgi:PAT family beta-lactamase induction signal transducer AmpG
MKISGVLSHCQKALSPYVLVYGSPRIAIMAFFGFSSGLPFGLTGVLLQAWMTKAGVNLHTIGIFSLIGVPYTIKFLWSPFMDRFVPPWLGRRRGWIILVQLGLLCGIAAMGFASPAQGMIVFGLLALFVAFGSASQDIVIDAYRTDLLREEERGAGAAVSVTAWRIGTLVSGGLGLILADHMGWQNTYLLMAGLMVIGIVAALWAPEPDTGVVAPKSMHEAVWGPFKDFFSRRGALKLLAAIVLYKLGDAYAETLSTAFLLNLNFSLSDVGEINKVLGTVSTIVGAAVAGSLMVRLGLFRSLLSFGALQLLSILSFMALALAGKSYPMMTFAVAFEKLCGGMGTSAFFALLMTLCNKRFTATQYALLSSLAALGRVFVGPTSGYIVESIGWARFFLFAAIAAVPGLILLYLLRGEIAGMTEKNRAESARFAAAGEDATTGRGRGDRT